MIILIYGDDAFRVTEKIKQMKQAFAQKFDPTGMNITSFPTGETTSLNDADVLQATCSFPFFGKKRMILIHNLLSSMKKADEEKWMDGFGRMPESSIVVLWESESIKTIEKKATFLLISKMNDVHCYPFQELQGSALIKWVSKRVCAKGGSIERDAIQMLIERVGANLWQMSQEIDKLIAYSNGTVITREHVDGLVQETFEERIFALMDAVSQKRSEEAMRLLQRERLAGSDDHYVLTMLGRQVRILMSIRACLDVQPTLTKQEIASRLDLHPFVVEKAMKQAKMFTFETLKQAHQLLFSYDLRIKTGTISPSLAVDLVTDHLVKT